MNHKTLLPSFLKLVAKSLAFLGLLCTPAWGQTVVQAANCLASSANACTATFGSTTTAGNAIYICAQQGQDSTTGVSITDSASQTYTQTSSGYDSNSNAGNRMGCWIKTNSASISSVTNTWGSLSTTIRAVALEISGIASSSAEDVSVNHDNGSSSATSLSTGSFTTTNAADILIGCFGWGGNTSSPVAGSGYTIPSNGSNVRLACETQTVSTAQSAVTASMSWTTGQDVDTIFAALKASSGGGTSPSITSLTPNSGAVGSSIVIAGSNFGSTQGTVTFNGTTATTISNWTANSITAVVPAGATTGNVVVTAGGVASNGVSFTVTPAPNISSLTPTSGPVGTSVTIAGSNFGSTQGSVKFNGTAAITISNWTANSITAVVPSGATTGNVVVTAAGGVASNGVSFTVTTGGGGGISSAQNPKWCSYSSASSGTCAYASNNTAGNMLFAFQSCNTTTATIQTPTDTAGNTWLQANAAVVNNGETSTSKTFYVQNAKSGADTVTYSSSASTTCAFVIWEVTKGTAGTWTLDQNHSNFNNSSFSTALTSNATGTLAQADELVIGVGGTGGSSSKTFTAGNGFTIPTGGSHQTTSFSSDAIEWLESNSTAAQTATMTMNASQDWEMFVATFIPPSSGGGSSPGISSLTPTSGAVGSSVVIAGSNFGSAQGSVTFNGTAATTISNWTATSITAVVPAGATTGNVVVTAGGVASNGVSFTVLPTPNITSLTPNSGSVGSSVVIAGSNFGSTQGSVTFNGTAATTISNWTATSITAVVPTSATTGNVVVTAGGVASNGVSFTVTTSPNISSLSPTSGPIGASVTINGSNFGSSQGSVTFNGTAATIGSWTSGSIGVTVPLGATTGNVVVTTAGGLSSNGVSFTVKAPYSFSVTYAPDGAVLTANDSINGSWIYSYDDFDRLATANNSSPVQGFSFGYDPYANRWQQILTAGTGGTSNLTFSNNPSAGTVGNCYHAAGVTNQPDGYCFDAAGNLLNDGTHSYLYDAQNRIISVDNGQTATYIYNAAGQRIRKVTPSGTADYLYDQEGHQVTELTGSGGWTRGEVYSGSRHVATYRNGTTYFVQSDWLGTQRVMTSLSGAECETTTNLPFGDGQATNGSCGDPSPMHFTGQPRDTETNLDYFGARFYASSMGRFVTPDWDVKPVSVPFASFGDPQSLNLYAYTRDNPVAGIDATGHNYAGWDGAYADRSNDGAPMFTQDDFSIDSSPLLAGLATNIQSNWPLIFNSSSLQGQGMADKAITQDTQRIVIPKPSFEDGLPVKYKLSLSLSLSLAELGSMMRHHQLCPTCPCVSDQAWRAMNLPQFTGPRRTHWVWSSEGNYEVYSDNGQRVYPWLPDDGEGQPHTPHQEALPSTKYGPLGPVRWPQAWD